MLKKNLLPDVASTHSANGFGSLVSANIKDGEQTGNIIILVNKNKWSTNTIILSKQ